MAKGALRGSRTQPVSRRCRRAGDAWSTASLSFRCGESRFSSASQRVASAARAARLAAAVTVLRRVTPGGVGQAFRRGACLAALTPPCGLFLPRSADISELNLAKTTTIFFPEGKTKLLNFEVTIRPDEGMYRRAVFGSLVVPV